MNHSCTLERAGATVRAGWALEGATLIVTAEGRSPEAIRLREVAGVGGDDFSLRLALGEQPLTLSRLGAEGPNLQAQVRQVWLPERADALRLAGAGAPVRCSGAMARGEGTLRSCQALLNDDALLLAAEDADIEPVFLALLEDIALDTASMTVQMRDWDHGVLRLAKLGGRTDEIATALQARRARLVAEAAQVMDGWLPRLDPARRATLAARWLPGRMLGLRDLDALVPGAVEAFKGSWLAAMPRRSEGEALMGMTGVTAVWAGYGRPATTGGAEPNTVPLWLLVSAGERWFLEAVSEQDWATYRFRGGQDMPALASRLLCAPEFSREALYLPLDRLAGVHGELAPAARDLGFLRELRTRFVDRVIHTSPEAWRAGLVAERTAG
jgi:hypothetical protein